MRRLKCIDFGLQIAILFASLILLPIQPFMAILVYFFGYLAYDTFSILIHALFFPAPTQKLKRRRMGILFHLFLIIAFLSTMYLFPSDFGWVYLAYAFCMPLYYLWMSFREIRYLEEIHDQASLLDISQH